MKSNRQIGLDGKIFVSGCLHNSPLFVFSVMISGLIAAVADIIKLVGESGAQLDMLTTSLLLFDLVSSLLLVAVVFYAYFLECGTSVPVLKQKPLVWFGFFRLGYHLLLAYYTGQKAFLCIVHTGAPITLGIFYAVYFMWLCALIASNCYIFNVLIKNSIRRSYEREFKRLAYFGFGVQCVLLFAYIVAALTAGHTDDVFFTSRFCDFLRFGLAPALSTGLWLIFLDAIDEVKMVFSQVDNALRERRYQIAYSDGREYGAAQKSVYTSALPVAKQAQADEAEAEPLNEDEQQDSADNDTQLLDDDRSADGEEFVDVDENEPENDESATEPEQGFEEVDISKLKLTHEPDGEEAALPEESNAAPFEDNNDNNNDDSQSAAESNVTAEPVESTAAARLQAAREAAQERKKQSVSHPEKRKEAVHPRPVDSTVAQRRAANARVAAENAARKAQSKDKSGRH